MALYRSRTFATGRGPPQFDSIAQVTHDEIRGPIPFLNPTRATTTLNSQATVLWTSRNTRKGRSTLLLHDGTYDNADARREILAGM